mmetsp:Transcript_8580/g.12809  ORF Transcript_8580/g.12809 Transcript_8580/m.12809 type:complete len:416 (-) Transcript_8580:16-1263(-)
MCIRCLTEGLFDPAKIKKKKKKSSRIPSNNTHADTVDTIPVKQRPKWSSPLCEDWWNSTVDTESIGINTESIRYCVVNGSASHRMLYIPDWGQSFLHHSLILKRLHDTKVYSLWSYDSISQGLSESLYPSSCCVSVYSFGDYTKLLEYFTDHVINSGDATLPIDIVLCGHSAQLLFTVKRNMFRRVYLLNPVFTPSFHLYLPLIFGNGSADSSRDNLPVFVPSALVLPVHRIQVLLLRLLSFVSSTTESMSATLENFKMTTMSNILSWLFRGLWDVYKHGDESAHYVPSILQLHTSYIYSRAEELKVNEKYPSISKKPLSIHWIDCYLNTRLSSQEKRIQNNSDLEQYNNMEIHVFSSYSMCKALSSIRVLSSLLARRCISSTVYTYECAVDESETQSNSSSVDRLLRYICDENK